MDIHEQTVKNCSDYLKDNSNVKCSFTKLAGESKGFMYEYQKDGPRVLMNLCIQKLMNEYYVLLIAHADVLVKEGNSAITAKYCQLHSDPWEPGMLAFSPKHRHLFYKISTPIIEHPISAESLEWMNCCAYEKLMECRDMLDFISGDNPYHLPEAKGKLETTTVHPFPSDNLQQTKDLLINGLQEEGGHNSIASFLSGADDALFYNQLLTEDSIFHEVIKVNKSGCIIVGIRPDLKVNPEKFIKAALICNKRSNILQPFRLHICHSDGHVWFASAISLWDGAIGMDSIRDIEAFGVLLATNTVEEIIASEGEEHTSNQVIDGGFPYSDEIRSRCRRNSISDVTRFENNDSLTLLHDTLPNAVKSNVSDPFSDFYRDVPEPMYNPNDEDDSFDEIMDNDCRIYPDIS